MKKILLTLGLVGAVVATQAQATFSVQAPATIAGSYAFNYATNTGTSPWTIIPDLTDPANVVIDTLMLVEDGSAADSLSCGTLVNDLTGKVAFLYRGSCEFGTKALNAQNAGAVAVVIVNNGGASVGMGAGAQGANVTIPVTMISGADGATIRAKMDAGDAVVVYIGANSGFYTNNVELRKTTSLVAKTAGVLATLSQDSTEFNVELGAWVYNNGINDQTGVVVTADVTKGSSLYNNVSPAVNIAVGDSSYFSFPKFSQTTYANGRYTLTYSVAGDSIEENTTDNSFSADFVMNDTYLSLVDIDMATGVPTSTSGYSVSDPNGFSTYTVCMAFRDSNASRLGVRGMSFAASTYDPQNPTSLIDESIELVAHEWNDVFVDLDDNPAVGDLLQVGYAEYTFDTEAQNDQIYVDFDEAFALKDNQRYLFCATTFSDFIDIGHDARIDYSQNEAIARQPTLTINDGASWFLGYANGLVPGFVIHTLPANAVGIEENKLEFTAYPNPTADYITIPLNNLEGTASLIVFDITGKQVMTQQINTTAANKLTVNVTDLVNGVYVFNLSMENGKTSTFNVVVSK